MKRSRRDREELGRTSEVSRTGIAKDRRVHRSRALSIIIPVGPDGDRWVAITASRKLRQGGWWLGLDWPKVEKRRSLAQSSSARQGKGCWTSASPASLSRSLLRKRVATRIAVRSTCGSASGDRYFLRIAGEDSIEVTSALGDLSWLPPPSPGRRTFLPWPRRLSAAERAFFARVRMACSNLSTPRTSRMGSSSSFAPRE